MSKRMTPLYALHEHSSARMVDFHGWLMPLQYRGIIAEHQAVRQACGCFDLCHMGRLRLSGPAAAAGLHAECTRDIAGMAPAQVRYSLLCNHAGCVDDDILVSREGAEAFHVVCNASNVEKVLARFQERFQNAPEDAICLENLSAEQAMIAVQGPESASILNKLGLDCSGLGYYRFRDVSWAGTELRLSRTGYTGEDGYELFISVSCVAALWQALLDQGVQPCGLGSRDILRLEAGMPLYGQELDAVHSPQEAGLGFAIRKSGGFVGAEALAAEREQGLARQLVGLRMDGRRPARSGYSVLDAEGRCIGAICSGTMSPSLGHPIATAYVLSEFAAPGTSLSIDLRGSPLAAEVCALPFYKRRS